MSYKPASSELRWALMCKMFSTQDEQADTHAKKVFLQLGGA